MFFFINGESYIVGYFTLACHLKLKSIQKRGTNHSNFFLSLYYNCTYIVCVMAKEVVNKAESIQLVVVVFTIQLFHITEISLVYKFADSFRQIICW